MEKHDGLSLEYLDERQRDLVKRVRELEKQVRQLREKWFNKFGLELG